MTSAAQALSLTRLASKHAQRPSNVASISLLHETTRPRMKFTIAYLLLALSTPATSLVALNIFRSRATTPQQPLMPAGQDPTPQGEVILSDVMARDKSINIFAGFTRDVACVETRLDNAKVNTTVLAPLNSAVEKLPRKPWEDPRDYGDFGADAYEGADGSERAQRNLRRFVEAHIVPRSPWKAGEKVQAVGGGRDVWWEEKDGKKVVSCRSILRGMILTYTRADSAWRHRGRQHSKFGIQRRGGTHSTLWKPLPGVDAN